ncbi:hypothetical protein MRX96_014164 [Rhipicephalus microplus]
MTPTGKATEATLESLAQVGASQTATGNPTLLEPSPHPSGHTTHPPEISASPLSDGVVSLPPTTPPRPQHPPSTLPLKGEHGHVVCLLQPELFRTLPLAARHPPLSAFGPMRSLVVNAFAQAHCEEARRKHQQKNGFPCQATTATNAPSSRQLASAAPPKQRKRASPETRSPPPPARSYRTPGVE